MPFKRHAARWVWVDGYHSKIQAGINLLSGDVAMEAHTLDRIVHCGPTFMDTLGKETCPPSLTLSMGVERQPKNSWSLGGTSKAPSVHL